MSYKLGNIGNFELTVTGSFIDHDKEEKFTYKVKRLDVPTAFDLQANCPLTFGVVEKNSKLTEREKIELLKEEHIYIIEKLLPYFPKEAERVLRNVDYIYLQDLVMYMMSGDDNYSSLPDRMADLLIRLNDEGALDSKKKFMELLLKTAGMEDYPTELKLAQKRLLKKGKALDKKMGIKTKKARRKKGKKRA